MATQRNTLLRATTTEDRGSNVEEDEVRRVFEAMRFGHETEDGAPGQCCFDTERTSVQDRFSPPLDADACGGNGVPSRRDTG